MPEIPSGDDMATTSASCSCPVCGTPFARVRRDNTVYECGECQTRYLGEQWCVECVRPCRRVGVGGLCPHCDEPVAIPDLLEAAETPAELEVITMPDR